MLLMSLLLPVTVGKLFLCRPLSVRLTDRPRHSVWALSDRGPPRLVDVNNHRAALPVTMEGSETHSILEKRCLRIWQGSSLQMTFSPLQNNHWQRSLYHAKDLYLTFAYICTTTTFCQSIWTFSWGLFLSFDGFPKWPSIQWRKYRYFIKYIQPFIFLMGNLSVDTK